MHFSSSTYLGSVSITARKLPTTPTSFLRRLSVWTSTFGCWATGLLYMQRLWSSPWNGAMQLPQSREGKHVPS